MSQSFYRRYTGYACENCRTVFSFRPSAGGCPECGPNADPLLEVAVTLDYRAAVTDLQPAPGLYTEVEEPSGTGALPAGRVVLHGNPCCGGNGVETGCEECWP